MSKRQRLAQLARTHGPATRTLTRALLTKAWHPTVFTIFVPFCRNYKFALIPSADRRTAHVRFGSEGDIGLLPG